MLSSIVCKKQARIGQQWLGEQWWLGEQLLVIGKQQQTIMCLGVGFVVVSCTYFQYIAV